MPAYQMDDDDGGSEIVFFANDQAACKFYDCDSVDRAPEFDKWENEKFIPPLAYLEDGWFLYCTECERRSDDEEEFDSEGEPIEPVIDTFKGAFYFCCDNCLKTFERDRAKVKADQEDFKVELRSIFPETQFPGFEILGVWGGNGGDMYASCSSFCHKFSMTKKDDGKVFFGGTQEVLESLKTLGLKELGT